MLSADFWGHKRVRENPHKRRASQEATDVPYVLLAGGLLFKRFHTMCFCFWQATYFSSASTPGSPCSDPLQIQSPLSLMDAGGPVELQISMGWFLCVGLLIYLRGGPGEEDQVLRSSHTARMLHTFQIPTSLETQLSAESWQLCFRHTLAIQAKWLGQLGLHALQDNINLFLSNPRQKSYCSQEKRHLNSKGVHFRLQPRALLIVISARS